MRRFTLSVSFEKSMLSMGQPRHGAHVITTAEKWTWDEGLLTSINVECKHFGLPVLSKLENTRVKIMISVHSHVFASGCYYHDELKNILSRARGNYDKITLGEEATNLDDFSHFCEWSKISEAKYVAETSISLLAKLRRGAPSCSPHSDGGQAQLDLLSL